MDHYDVDWDQDVKLYWTGQSSMDHYNIHSSLCK